MSSEKSALLGGELPSLPGPAPEKEKRRLAPATIALIVVLVLLLVGGAVAATVYFLLPDEEVEESVDCTLKHPAWNSYSSYPSVQQAGRAIDLAKGTDRGRILEDTFALCQVTQDPLTQTIYRLPDYVRDLVYDTRVETNFGSTASRNASGYSVIEAERVASTVSGGVGLGFSWFGIGVEGVHSQSEAVLNAHSAYQKEFSYISKVSTEIVTATAELNAYNLVLTTSFLNTLLSLPSRAIPLEGRTADEERELGKYLLFVEEYGSHFVKKGFLGGLYTSQFSHQREKMETASFSAEYTGSCLAAEASVGFGWGVTASIKARYEECQDQIRTISGASSFAQASTEEKTVVVGGDSGAAADLSVRGADPEAFSEWAATVRNNPSLLSSQLWPLSDLLTKQMLHPDQQKRFGSKLETYRENLHVALAEHFNRRNPQVACAGVCPEGETPYQDASLRCLCEPPYQKTRRRLYSGGQGDLLAWVPEDSGYYTNSIKGYSSHFDVSPDGKWLAVPCGGYNCFLDPENFRLLKKYSSSASNAKHITFSPDGRRFAYTPPVSSRVYVHDSSTGLSVLTISASTTVGKFAFSPDGTEISVAAGERITVYSSTGLQLRVLVSHGYQITDVVYSPDGNRLASSDTAGYIKIWNAKLGGSPLLSKTHTCSGQKACQVNGLAYSPDGKQLLSAIYLSKVIVWAADSLSQISTLPVNYVVWSVAYSPDGALFAAASSSGESKLSEVRLYDSATRKLVYTLRGHTSVVKKVLFDPVRHYQNPRGGSVAHAGGP